MRKTVKFSLLFLRHSFYFFHSSVIKTLTFSQGKMENLKNSFLTSKTGSEDRFLLSPQTGGIKSSYDSKLA